LELGSYRQRPFGSRCVRRSRFRAKFVNRRCRTKNKDRMPESTKAIFMSYASQDSDAARRIGDALREARLG